MLVCFSFTLQFYKINVIWNICIKLYQGHLQFTSQTLFMRWALSINTHFSKIVGQYWKTYSLKIYAHISFGTFLDFGLWADYMSRLSKFREHIQLSHIIIVSQHQRRPLTANCIAFSFENDLALLYLKLILWECTY